MISPYARMEPEAVETVQDAKRPDREDLMRSAATSSTDSGSFSSEEESFFEALGADLRVLASSLRDTAGGVANFVHQSALTVAAEIARLEEEDMQTHARSSDGASLVSKTLRLPWEIESSTLGDYAANELLKDRIFALSLDESCFLVPHENSGAGEFVLDAPRIDLIQRLLDLDENLAHTHARLAGRSDVRETEIWKNYFDRCEAERLNFLDAIEIPVEDDDLSVPGPSLTIDISSAPDSPNSLVSAKSLSSSPTGDAGDAGSFVLPTPPQSGNSTGIRSVESLVIVDEVYYP